MKRTHCKTVTRSSPKVPITARKEKRKEIHLQETSVWQFCFFSGTEYLIQRRRSHRQYLWWLQYILLIASAHFKRTRECVFSHCQYSSSWKKWRRSIFQDHRLTFGWLDENNFPVNVITTIDLLTSATIFVLRLIDYSSGFLKRICWEEP